VLDSVMSPGGSGSSIAAAWAQERRAHLTDPSEWAPPKNPFTQFRCHTHHSIVLTHHSHLACT
jgi:hypothetical protein